MYIYIYIYIYILEISPASRDIISSVIHMGVLGVVGCAWHCGMCLAFLEIFSVHIHKVYAQIKSFGLGAGVFAPLQPPYELKDHCNFFLINPRLFNLGYSFFIDIILLYTGISMMKIMILGLLFWL